MGTKYDTIGVNYADLRQPDARIAAMIGEALGSAQSVLNVGAGAGSYEPPDRAVTALEPSMEMIRQRPASATPVVRARAEALPFADRAFDASMASLTVHHWTDRRQGVQEMRRVTRGPLVILTFDHRHQDFWLTDYIPELMALDEGRMPLMRDFEAWLGPVEISTVPVPHDCTDGFLGAYWRRPAAYLDPRVRAAISCFWALGDASGAYDRLADDIRSGVWAARYADLLDRDSHDLGYRLVVARG